MEHENAALTLPIVVVSPTDVARLKRELEMVEAFFQQQAIRQPGQQAQLPRLSRLLDKLVAENRLNLLLETDRQRLTQFIDSLRTSAPVLHISFSADPPGAYIEKVVTWLRRNIHQSVLVTVGLQPNIGAGCIVRTTNKMFDFSLREYFTHTRESFIARIHEALTEGDDTPQVQVPQQPTQTTAQPPSAPSPQGVSS